MQEIRMCMRIVPWSIAITTTAMSVFCFWWMLAYENVATLSLCCLRRFLFRRLVFHLAVVRHLS